MFVQRMLWFCLYAAISFLCFSSGYCFSQQLFEDKYEKHLLWAMLGHSPEISYSVNFDGVIKASFDEIDTNSLSSFVNDVRVHELLDLSGLEINKLGESLDKLEVGLRISEKKVSEDLVPSAELSIDECLSSFLKDVKESIGPKRFAQFLELQSQILALQIGFDGWLEHTFLPSTKDKNKRAAAVIALSVLKDKELEFCEKVRDHETELAKWAFEEVLKFAPEGSRDVIRQRWERVYCRPGGGAQFYMQLNSFDDKELVLDADDFLNTICQLPKVALAAHFGPRLVGSEPRDIPAIARFNMLCHCMKTPGFQKRLEILPLQLAEFGMILDDFSSLKWELNSQIGLRLGCESSRLLAYHKGEQVWVTVYNLDSVDGAYSQYCKEIESDANVFVGRINDVFLAFQKEWLQDEVKELISIRRGIRFDLFEGTLGETLKLKASEREELSLAFQDVEKAISRRNRDFLNSEVRVFFESVSESEVFAGSKKRFGELPDDVFVDFDALYMVWSNRLANDR